MPKHISLINEIFLNKENKDVTLLKKYLYLKKIYDKGATYILLNNVDVFGPFPRATVPWDISEAQKIATYNSEVTEVLNWVNSRIVINLGVMTYKTLDVLIRIATGMLNKCDIPKSVQIMFHDNMTRNLHKEYDDIVVSELPF